MKSGFLFIHSLFQVSLKKCLIDWVLLWDLVVYQVRIADVFC